MSRPATDPLLSTLGLCARARKLIIGTPMVCEAMRRGGPGTPLAVLEASDTSENTSEKLRSKCTYYRIPLYRLSADTEALGHAIGKSSLVAAVAVTDAQLLVALGRHLPPPTIDPTTIPDRPAADPLGGGTD